MAIYPHAKVRNIPPGANDPAITVIGAILHVAAGTSASLYPYFSGPSGGIESHFYIQEKGTTEQYRDTRYEADANLHGNSFIKGGKRLGYVSIETWGLEPGEWNAAQLAEIKRLLTWLSDTHNFPLVRCATATSPGVGYHVMFGAPGPWTPVAKSCPGPKRVKQFNNILVPWMAHPTQPVEDDMSADDVKAINDYSKAAATQIQAHIDQMLAPLSAKVDALEARVESLDTEVAKAVWDEQIPDVLTPESGDTAAARTHLTWMPNRVAEALKPPQEV